jgi:hypothetical protein
MFFFIDKDSFYSRGGKVQAARIYLTLCFREVLIN